MPPIDIGALMSYWSANAHPGWYAMNRACPGSYTLDVLWSSCAVQLHSVISFSGHRLHLGNTPPTTTPTTAAATYCTRQQPCDKLRNP